MTSGNADRELLHLVQQRINSGAKVIQIPASLVTNASDQALESARQLAKLTGVKIEVLG